MMVSRDNEEVAGRVIVITGASQGIGAAIARAFASGGTCSLALLARNEDRLRAVADECRAWPGVRAEAFRCDVTDPASVKRVAATAVETMGRVDVLVNNAGEFAGAPFLEFSVEEFDRQMTVNTRSAFLVSQAFAAEMAQQGAGDIVNICSVAGLRAHPGGTGYSAAKAGLLGLTRVMREELKACGIRVMAVVPGATFTPSWEGSDVEEERLMPAEDVARAVADIVSLSRRTVVEEIVLQPFTGDL